MTQNVGSVPSPQITVLWTCKGCGYQVDSSEADQIVEHVQDCDLVDGAGEPVNAAADLGSSDSDATDVDYKVLVIKNGECSCGCGIERNPRSTFVMGHDQRLMSFLISAHRTNAKVAVNFGEAVSPIEAGGWFLTDTGTAKLRRYLSNDRSVPKPRKAGADQEPLSFDPPAEDVQVAADGYTFGAPVQVKVGRWTYDAKVHGMSQSGKVTAVEYTDKSGTTKTTDKFTLV